MADVPESFDVHVQRSLDIVKEDRGWSTGHTREDACQAGTVGCSIDHDHDHGSCEGW